jgi:hypothetical protein
MCLIAVSDRHDAPGLIDDLVPCAAAVVDGVAVRAPSTWAGLGGLVAIRQAFGMSLPAAKSPYGSGAGKRASQ